MPAHGTEFHYRIGRLARLFGSADHDEIVLADGVLRIARRDGSTETLVPDDLVPQIRHRKGLCWDSLSFRHRDGRQLRLGGMRRADAQILERLLEAWLSPAREGFFGELERKLRMAEALVAPLLGGSRYVRCGELAAVAEPLRESIAQIALLAEVSGGPPALVERVERLREVTGALRGGAAEANERFVTAELARFSGLFDTVESKPLTPAQRRACVINDDHNLVLAGAGTGKTSVMIGRVGYLLSAGLADGSATLMVAYNRDAAREMRDRVATRLAGVPGADALTIKTFHALGKEILAEVDGRQPSVSPLAEDDAKLQAFVTRLLDEALNESEYAGKFIEYGFDLHEPHRALFDFKSLPEYERELAKLDLRTLNGERVKSGEELRIANFLMRNGVDYAYEQPFPIETADHEHRQYRPDFTIRRDSPDASPVFLEHFGVDATGNPPPFFSEAQAAAYREGMRWKRAICQQHQLTLIETYSYQFRPEVVFDRLTAQLVAHSVTLRQRSDAECLDILRGSAIVTETARLFAGLIPIIREHGLGQVEIGQRIAAVPAHERGRAQLLWELLRPIVEGYERHLASTGEIDFADMIGRAADLVRSGQYRPPFTHLLIDEFQDISGPRARLILALSRQRADSTVFCVGATGSRSTGSPAVTCATSASSKRSWVRGPPPLWIGHSASTTRLAKSPPPS
jgi:DNA helicase-4